MSEVTRAVGRFSGDRRGNFAVAAAFCSSVLALAAGFGVNTAQSYQVKMALRDALDAAVTSTARDLTTGVIKEADVRASVERFLLANGDTRFMTGDSFVLDGIVVDKAAKTVEATASARVELAFGLFREKTPRVVVESAAIYSDKRVEIAMMLDVTQSMEANTRQRTDKIGDLIDAATNAVNLAMDQNRDPKNPRVRIALVPYADAVNVGALADQAVFREASGGSNLPQPLDAPIAASASTPDNCATERKLRDGSADFSDDGPFAVRLNDQGKDYYAKVNRDDRLSTKNCPNAELVPLTADRDKLVESIADYEAVGVTAGAIGIQWTYYMLSPRWRDVIVNADLGKGPANHAPNKTVKVAILMTDGQFNTAYAGIKDGNAFRVSDAGAKKSSAYSERLCDNMKADGIQVFTVGFDLNNASMSADARAKAKAVLKDCASPDTSALKHYFEASTGAELDAAFSEIISNTERLALTR
jgi:Flp pilus assembly protein TadG